MRSTSILAGSVLILLSAPALAAEPPSLPDPIMTPGAVEPAATWDVVCNGTTRTRRNVSAAMKAAVLAGYNIPDNESPYYEIDHLVPLAIGGANVVANLWPEPWAEAVQKDVLEVELQRRVCHGLVSQVEAQREVADDWATAYTRYVGGVPVGGAGRDRADGERGARATNRKGAPEGRGATLGASMDFRSALNEPAQAGAPSVFRTNSTTLARSARTAARSCSSAFARETCCAVRPSSCCMRSFSA